jgi:FMN-dependent NADH-azoreductase
MTSLLHIDASPRKQRSASRQIARAFIDAYRGVDPSTEVTILDLWEKPLPEFDEHAMEAKYAGLSGTPLTDQQMHAWDQLRAWADLLHRADILVFSIPMWNFSIPYKLKHFIDLVSQKDILFAFNPAVGFSGLLRNKKAIVAYARGLDYSSQSATPAGTFDFQKSYFEAWLRFVGVAEVHALVTEKTLLSGDTDRSCHRQCIADAARLAKQI